MKNTHHENKKDFQLERLLFFSDAVFAIAITLLIIEIKLPELKEQPISEHLFIENLLALLPRFAGFFISFFMIGLYWFVHHTMFGYVVNYNAKLIWLNMIFLFSIVLMPFSTGVYSEYSSPKLIYLISPYVVYVINICMTGILNFFMLGYIGNPKNRITENFPQGDYLKKAKIRALAPPFIFVLSLLVAKLVNPIIGRFVLFLIPVFMSFIRNKKTE